MQHVPIPMQQVYCDKKCCVATHCPLVLAWATTIHKFQGFEAGFDENDPIKYIIADINSLEWEKLHPGTAYVVTSRAKTIGNVTSDNPYPLDSNLFFDGQISKPRLMDVTKRKDGSTCCRVEQRTAWIDYLETKVPNTKSKYNENELARMKGIIEKKLEHPFAQNAIGLDVCIMNIIKHPNEIWKERRQNYLI